MPANGKQRRISLRIDESLAQRIEYWVAKSKDEGSPTSMNEFLEEAVLLKIRHLNGDFDSPSLLVNRLNELIEATTTNTATVDNLRLAVVSGLDSLTSLARGDDPYLADTVDPDLS